MYAIVTPIKSTGIRRKGFQCNQLEHQKANEMQSAATVRAVKSGIADH
jgi:hypothetical protein